MITGCSSSSKTTREEPEIAREESESGIAAIFRTAAEEQNNPMYATESDSVVLYWLDDLEMNIPGQSKCNIFALNVLSKSGYLMPAWNCTTSDLFDTSAYREEFRVISFNDAAKAEPGDLIVWNGHVIIFERLAAAGDREYALGWWGGSKQADNGTNIINGVCRGKYPLEEDFVVRRPVLKISKE